VTPDGDDVLIVSPGPRHQSDGHPIDRGGL